MPNADILWFKQQFRDEVEAAVIDTLFDIDMIAALACQETGEIWPILQRKGLPRQHVLQLCVGDTLDAGSVNFRYGAGKPGWWKSKDFAESGFWIHS